MVGIQDLLYLSPSLRPIMDRWERKKYYAQQEDEQRAQQEQKQSSLQSLLANHAGDPNDAGADHRNRQIEFANQLPIDEALKFMLTAGAPSDPRQSAREQQAHEASLRFEDRFGTQRIGHGPNIGQPVGGPNLPTNPDPIPGKDVPFSNDVFDQMLSGKTTSAAGYELFRQKNGGLGSRIIPGSKAERTKGKEDRAFAKAEANKKFTVEGLTNDVVSIYAEIAKHGNLVTGILGLPLSKIGLTSPAYKVAKDIKRLEAETLINSINSLREESATGSTGLGQLSDREGDTLRAMWGAINEQGLSPEQLKFNLRKYLWYAKGRILGPENAGRMPVSPLVKEMGEAGELEVFGEGYGADDYLNMSDDVLLEGISDE